MQVKIIYAALLGFSISTLTLSAQVSYGPGAGTAGSTNSFFGENAGNSALSSSAENVAVGRAALKNLSSGDYNIGIGSLALFNNTSSSYNIAIGSEALYFSNGGSANVAIGFRNLYFNTTGSRNVSLGFQNLYSNTTGFNNVAIGHNVMYSNISGRENTAVGVSTLSDNTTGDWNTAIGGYALLNNTTGFGNVAGGYSALQSNETGVNNTALGYEALLVNKTGSYHVAIGSSALRNHTTGSSNVAVGRHASDLLATGDYNAAVGSYSAATLTSGSFNIAHGAYALNNISGGSDNIGMGFYSGATILGTYNNSIAIGYLARFSASNQVRLGNSSMTSIGGQVGWTSLSDARFKSEVQEDVLGLDFIKALRPVSYKVDRDAIAKFDGVATGERALPTAPATYHTGFLAQEVEQTAKALGFERFDGVDAPTNEHGRYGLRYSSFVVPLVKSVQELSTQVDEQTSTIEALRELVAQQNAQIAQQQAQIDALLKHTQQQTTTDVDLPSTDGAVLYQNAPNPFSKETTIRLSLPATVAKASLIVTNLEGRQLLQQPITERGETSWHIRANQLPAGLYIYTLVVDDQLIDSKKMLITE